MFSSWPCQLLGHNFETIQDKLDTTNPVWVLTAWNPRSKPLSLAENLERNQSLMFELQKGPSKFHLVRASSLSGNWHEDSFAIWGPATHLAAEVEQLVLALAGKFEQNAVFKFEGNLQTLVPILVKEAAGSQTYCLNHCSADAQPSVSRSS